MVIVFIVSLELNELFLEAEEVVFLGNALAEEISFELAECHFGSVSIGIMEELLELDCDYLVDS